MVLDDEVKPAEFGMLVATSVQLPILQRRADTKSLRVMSWSASRSIWSMQTGFV